MRLLFLTSLLLCMCTGWTPSVNGLRLRTAIRNGQALANHEQLESDATNQDTDTDAIQTQVEGGFSSPIGTISFAHGVMFRTDPTGRLYRQVPVAGKGPAINWVPVPIPNPISSVSYDGVNTVCGVSSAPPAVVCNRGTQSVSSAQTPASPLSWAPLNMAKTGGAGLVKPTQVIVSHEFVLVLDDDENLWFTRYISQTGQQAMPFLPIAGPELVQVSLEFPISGPATPIMCGIGKINGAVYCHDNAFVPTPQWRQMSLPNGSPATGLHVSVCSDQTLLIVTRPAGSPPAPVTATAPAVNTISATPYVRKSPQVALTPLGSIPVSQVSCDIYNYEFVTLGGAGGQTLFTAPTPVPPKFSVPLRRLS